MKKYTEIEMEIIRFTKEDVITASGDEAIKNERDDVVEDFFKLS